MNEKEYSNVFKFSLYQGDVLLGEKIFDADQFNPFTRYSIDIRDILPKAITKLQKTLSKKSYDVIFETGRKDTTISNSINNFYNLYQYHQAVLHSFPKELWNYLQYNPQSMIQQIEEKVIKGVECKIGFYINDNPIVERLFYVDGFNPVARWSIDLVYAVIDITDLIFDKIKKSDIKNMWDDYDLINYKGFSINQIREFSQTKREDLLRKINKRF
jgi:hypothetical protein